MATQIQDAMCANLTMTLAFDAAGRRRTLVVPSGGTFTYGYDLADRGRPKEDIQHFVVN